MVGKPERLLVKFLLLVEQDVHLAATHHTQKMNGGSLLLFALLCESATLIWAEFLTPLVDVAPIVEICMPKAVENRALEYILFDELAEQLLDAGYISKCRISHHAKQVPDFVLYAHIHAEVQAVIALNHGLHYGLILAVYQGQHFPDAGFCVRKPVAM